MSDFQNQLDAFFVGSASLQELEQEIDQLAPDAVESQRILEVLKREFANGRLPTQIYHALKNRLGDADTGREEATRYVRPQEDSNEETIQTGKQEDYSRKPAEQTIRTKKPDDAAHEAVDATRLAGAPILPTQRPTGGGSAESEHPGEETRVTSSNWARPDEWTDTASGPIQVGSVIKNRFVIDSELGKGGMGIVFQALDRRKEEARDSDPYVAIKILNEEFRSHPQALISLEREASKAQTLAHPNIITVFDFDRDGTTVYMTMELMRGESLSDRIKSYRRGGANREEAVPIIMEMAAGLAYAHKREIVHSDFKPGNVFLTDDDRVKVLDFGIARATKYGGVNCDGEAEFDAGDLGALTPAYASLEMLDGEAPHPADDVYALAVTAYTLLFGEHPFNRLTAKEAYEKGLKPRPIKGLKRREWKAIENGLTFLREDRFQNADDFLRKFRGPTKVARSAAAAIAILGLTALYFAYESFQEPPPPFPWTNLTVAEQSDFTEKVASGQAWLDNDPPWLGGAYSDFSSAYEIHPRNPLATKGLRAVADAFIELAEGTDIKREKQRILDDLDAVSENEYLAEHKGLRKLKEELEDDLSRQ